MAQKHLMGSAIAGDITFCNIAGGFAPAGDGSDCDLVDISILQRHAAGAATTVGDLCKPYFGE